MAKHITHGYEGRDLEVLLDQLNNSGTLKKALLKWLQEHLEDVQNKVFSPECFDKADFENYYASLIGEGRAYKKVIDGLKRLDKSK